MTNFDLQVYADASLDHRDISEPDVATATHEVQKWAELEVLRDQGRL